MHSRKKHGRYGLALAGLLILVAIILLLVKPWNFSGKGGKQILLTQVEKIDQIIIAGPLGTVELSRMGDVWTLPGGERAIPVAVENILFAAGRLQIDAVQDAVQGDLSGELSAWEEPGLKVLSFSSGGKPVLQYEALGSEGRFMILPSGSGKAYAVSLPGYPELDLNQVFSEEENHYLDHVLLDLLPEEIRRVEVEKKGSPPFSFTRDEAGVFSFEGAVAEDQSGGQSGGQFEDQSGGEDLNQEALRMLFTYFRSIRYEQKAGELQNLPGAEDLKERWLATISVETTKGEKHSLKVCSLPGEGGEEDHMFLAFVFHNNSPDALLVKYVYLDVLMRDFPAYFGDNSLRH